MGFLSEIKKLLFASKSVAKHQGEKGIEYGMDKGAEIANKGKDVLEDVGGNILNKTTGLRDAVLEKSGDTLGSLKDTAGDAFGSLKDTASKTYDSLADNELVNKAGDFAENVGSKVMDTGGDLLDKAGDVSETVGAKVLDVKDDLVEKLATPANWEKGDDCVISPSVSNEQAKEMFPKGFTEVKPYLRLTPDPEV